MERAELHKSICGRGDKLSNWYLEKLNQLAYPVYSSYDIRDAGFKIANVDANIFPAGFNNICPADKDSSIELMNSYLKSHYGSDIKRILLVTEEHTNNPYYWENVQAISKIIEATDRQILLSIPKPLEQPLSVSTISGEILSVHSAYENSAEVRNFSPQLIISNNDFSESYEDWAQQISLPVNPPRELGWYQRRKDRYFKNYNMLATEFSELVGFDPFFFTVQTEISRFDLSDDEGVNKLAEQADQMLTAIATSYRERKITQEPVVFIKNNSGTYGLAVLAVRNGQEVKDWNYKSRKKMKAAKGGRDVEEVIIQEGIPTRVKSEGVTAEPVIYMIGCELAGGFLRTHADKTDVQSLNSPGAVYKKLCISDLNVSIEGSPLENVYGWSARLGLLAIALEAQEMSVDFKNFKK